MDAAAPIGFLLLIVVVGGIVAYVADNLGRKFGKQRRTLWKLRPRHTAAVMTALSGMGISLFTILLVMAVSSDVRTWILRGNAAVGEAQRNLERLQQTEKQRKEATDLLATVRKQVSDLQGRQDKLRDERDKLQANVGSMQDRVEELREESEKYRGLVTAAETRLRQAQARLTSAERELLTTNTSLAAARKERDDAKKSFAWIAGELSGLQEEQADVEYQLSQKEKELEDAEAELNAKQAELDRLDSEVSRLSASVTATEQQLETTNQELEGKTQELGRTLRELDAVSDQLATIKRSLDANLLNSRTRLSIIDVGQELARVSLPPGQSPQQVEAALNNAIMRSRSAASDFGAEPRSDGLPVANLLDQQLANGTIVTAEDQRRAVVQAATNLNEEAVIIVSAFWNVFEGEDVPLVAAAFRNPLIYTQGEIIAETRVDGASENSEILQAINEFLSVRVKQEAAKDKMIPTGGREPGFGSLSLTEVIEIAGYIKDARRQVRLLAVAKTDIRAADPLRIELKLR